MKRLRCTASATVRQARPDSALPLSPPSLRISRLARAASEATPVRLRGVCLAQLPERFVRRLTRVPLSAMQHVCSMAESADLSRVLALTNKGDELMLKGHYARAAEKFALALEEAERVLPASPDCLIMAALRQYQVEALLGHATAWVARPEDANDALRKALFHLLPAVVDVIQRRKAAGTLLAGTCRPAEVAFFAAEYRCSLALQGFSEAVIKAESAAPYGGLGIFMSVASAASFVLMNIMEIRGWLELSDAETEAQYQAAMRYVASALELMVLPRPGCETWVHGELGMVCKLRALIPKIRGEAEAGNYVAQQLHNAWRRVQLSGVLQTREIDDGIQTMEHHQSSLCAKRNADVAAGRLRGCALASCAAREWHLAQFKQCAACMTVVYCSREHQLADWQAHKAACKAARKA